MFLDFTCSSIPEQILNITHLIYKAIQIGVPIILIIVGMFDMGKAITQQKEDEIKKAQSLLVKKAIAAGLVFLMFSIVQLVVSVVSPDTTASGSESWACVKEILGVK
ncbi:MAG: hypothetical protein MR265_03880 [Erysipelotrichaceae bacterium]|nr:hypothetical protein [Erysipelotrichaceae bacterium]